MASNGDGISAGACGIRFNLIARPRGTLTFSFCICGGLVSGDSCEICFRLRFGGDDEDGGGAQTMGQSVGGVALASAADF